MRIQVKDFMSTPVITGVGEDNVQDIKTVMKVKGINAIPIVSYSKDAQNDEMTIRGIVTATDLSKDVNENTTLNDVMTTSSVHVVHVDSSAQSAAKMMLRHKVHHIVVMDEGEIKGMISSLDFVKLVAEYSLE
ncbi:CBS domain-containing protein [Psychroserpens sp. AS72]|uniref:CBS domain-containing protein n=1 Tax=Psychroserpens sp. AS72 TaxID=3135775 RepID=UPI00316AFCC2